MEEAQPASEATSLAMMIEEIIGLDSAPTDFDLITQIEELQTLTNAAHGAIARLSTEFDASQRAEQRRNGVGGSRVGRGVSDQIALARKQSPSQASRDLGLAKALRDDLPCTADLFTRGVVNAEVARAVHRETSHLGAHERRQADHQLAPMLPAATARGAGDAARKVAYAIDPRAAVDRAAKAVEDRAVWARPAPDTMCKVTALVSAAQGVSAYATLRRDAQAVIAAGDPGGRTLAQLMADLFIERATGQATASGTPVEVQLVMTPGQLFGDNPPTSTETSSTSAETASAGSGPDTAPAGSGPDSAPASETAAPTSTGAGAAASSDSGHGSAADTRADCAGTGIRAGARSGAGVSFGAGGGSGVDTDPDGPVWLNSYGPVPAALARAIIAGAPDLLGATPAGIDRAQAWVRRLFTDPASGQLIDVDTTRRAFEGTVRRFIRIRDQVCRVPFCDAPIRDLDHLHRHTDGGPTSIDNGAGVCQRFNHVKELPGWTTQVIHGDGADDHDRRAGPDPGAHPHTIRITTPTGKTYTSTSPPVHGTSASMPQPDTPAEVVRVKYTDLLALAS